MQDERGRGGEGPEDGDKRDEGFITINENSFLGVHQVDNIYLKHFYYLVYLRSPFNVRCVRCFCKVVSYFFLDKAPNDELDNTLSIWTKVASYIS